MSIVLLEYPFQLMYLIDIVRFIGKDYEYANFHIAIKAFTDISYITSD